MKNTSRAEVSPNVMRRRAGPPSEPVIWKLHLDENELSRGHVATEAPRWRCRRGRRHTCAWRMAAELAGPGDDLTSARLSSPTSPASVSTTCQVGAAVIEPSSSLLFPIDRRDPRASHPYG